nr:ComF family protein [uncultured Pseudodesulfovibrio sp.]
MDRSSMTDTPGLLHSLAHKIGLTAKRCPVCGVVMGSSGHMCESCTAAIPLRTGGYCPTCGLMSGRTDSPPSQCPECRLNPPPWDALYFHGQHADVLRELIISYKFNNNFGRSHFLSTLACTTFQAQHTRMPDIIVPVPLHTRRLLWRGFNQSLEISKIIGKTFELPVLKDGLTRIRNTPPQTRFGHKERMENIRNAFAARAKCMAEKTVLLVDDVYTTGATLRECARTVKQAGALGVDILVLARTQQESS